MVCDCFSHNERKTHWRLPWLSHRCKKCELIQRQLVDATSSFSFDTPESAMKAPPIIPRRRPVDEQQPVVIKAPNRPSDVFHSNYAFNRSRMTDYQLHQRLSVASVGSPYRSWASSVDYVPCNPMPRKAPPPRPLTRLPNAIPLDVAVAKESSLRREEQLRSPLRESPEDAPKRPQHPSIESQLLCQFQLTFCYPMFCD